MFAAIRTSKTTATTHSAVSATCRRDGSRRKVRPLAVTAWSALDAPVKVAAIEADSRGARLMLPWQVAPGETISVSLGDEVGLFQTRNARVVWTQTLEVTGRVVAGVAFDTDCDIEALAVAV